ncbi:MAG: hypothetical protein GYB68_05350 [Chloroflexi bacterium]|nr:hypothetical protein [Chloroflexota bacterium]
MDDLDRISRPRYDSNYTLLDLAILLRKDLLDACRRTDVMRLAKLGMTFDTLHDSALRDGSTHRITEVWERLREAAREGAVGGKWDDWLPSEAEITERFTQSK